jgi:beta-N-acetylhexosaminidase
MSARNRTTRWAALAVGALAVTSLAVAAGNSASAGVGTPALTAASLTPAQEAGQRIIYSYPGLTPPTSLINAIKAGDAAGVIFFGENISSDVQISSVIQELDQAAAQSPIHSPLLLMTDQEGGEVRRLPGDPALSEKQVGEAANPTSAASTAGTGAGQNLASVGMNVNLAPVLDVYRTAGDFDDQFQRSYSSDPNVVSTLGSTMLKAQQAQGVAAAVKHFPGLGAATASEDTDAEPVTLNQSLSDIRNIDEKPYPAAISAGTKMVMTSWAVYPALDPTYPAGLSSTIVQGELRQRLGFKGVTVTDALEAGALENFGSTGNRAVLAAKAGMDLILCSARDASQGTDAANALVSALNNGTLSSADFTASVNRVLALRANP